MEAMRFSGTLQTIIHCVLAADPCLGPVYLRKVYLSDAYMSLWVQLEDLPYTALLVPKKTQEELQLVGFHFSLKMGYVDSASYFYMTTETVTNLANTSIATRHESGEHPL